MKRFVFLACVLLASCGGGSSSPSSSSPPPGIPASVTATAGDGQVTIGWAAVSGAASYDIYYSTSSGVSTASSIIKGVQPGYVVTGLANGTTYYFAVAAVNNGGESALSSEVSATPQPPIPAKPTGVVASGQNTQVTLGWSSVPGATSYNVYYDTASGVTTSSLKVTGVNSGSAITGLTNGITYYFGVTAVNVSGESPISSEVSATPNITLIAPTGFGITGGDKQVSLSWNSVSGATSYNIYYGTAPGVFPSGTKTTGVTTTSTTISGLTDGTTYYFAVTAVGGGTESQPTSELSATPQVPTPGAPTGVNITGGDAQVTLSWPGVSGATSYNIYYGVTAGVVPSSAKITGATSGTPITGLINGTTYYFVVTAVSAGGESSPSPIVSATPQFPPGWTNPSTSAANNITASQATLGGSFTSPSSYTTQTWIEWGTTISYELTPVPLSSNPHSKSYSYPGTIYPSFDVGGLSASTIYHYRFCTQNTDGTWCGQDATFKTLPATAPASIATGLVDPAQFTIDATNAYWTEVGNSGDGSVKYKPLAGGAVTTLASGLSYPDGIAVDANNVYFAEENGGNIKYIPLSGGGTGCTVSITVDSTGAITGATLVAGGSGYTNNEVLNVGTTVPVGGALAQVTVTASGGVVTAVTLTSNTGSAYAAGTLSTSVNGIPLAVGLHSPQYVAVDASSVYFTELGTWNSAAGLRNSDGTVNKVPKAGGSVVQLATKLDEPQTIAVDATNIYWAEQANYIGGASTIEFVPLGSSCTDDSASPPLCTQLVSGLTGAQNIAIDSTDLYYWSGYGILSKVPLGGGTSVQVASVTGTQPLATDSASVYWTESSYGGVVRVLDKTTYTAPILISGFSNPMGIAVDNTNVYWMLGDTFNSTTSLWNGTGAIVATPK